MNDFLAGFVKLTISWLIHSVFVSKVLPDRECNNMTGADENCVTLYFTDCIVQREQKADASVVLSCLEEALHALRKRFPHVNKLIAQSDNTDKAAHAS